MRKVFAPMMIALMVGACATGSTATIDEVQKLTTKFCAFVPTAKTIAEILTSGNGAGSGTGGGGGGNFAVNKATAIASAICAAVTTNPQSEGNVPGRYVPVVNGVKIEGYKVKR